MKPCFMKKSCFMKKMILVLSVVWLLGLGSFVSAESFLDPIGEGIKKILSAPFEIPRSIIQDSENTNPITGIITGTVKGTVRGAGQIGEGTVDVVTAPVKGGSRETNLKLNQPITRDEFEPWMDQEDPFDKLENFDPARQ